MARYIERSEVLRIATKYHDLMLAYELAELPTADVVEVVRCKDCKHYRDSFPYDTCDVFDAKATDAEDFCSYGDRKETEDDMG